MRVKPAPAGVNAEIRAGMARHGLRQSDVGRTLDLSQASIGARLNGTAEWRLVELLAVAALIGVPFLDLCAAWEREQLATDDDEVNDEAADEPAAVEAVPA